MTLILLAYLLLYGAFRDHSFRLNSLLTLSLFSHKNKPRCERVCCDALYGCFFWRMFPAFEADQE